MFLGWGLNHFQMNFQTTQEGLGMAPQYLSAMLVDVSYDGYQN